MELLINGIKKPLENNIICTNGIIATLRFD